MRKLSGAFIFLLGFTVAGLLFSQHTVTAQTDCPTATPFVETLTPAPTAPVETGTQDNPVPLGSVAHITDTVLSGKTAKYDMLISKIYRGTDALDKLKEANSLNGPAPVGKEYILFFVEVKYLEGPSGEALNLSYSDFKIFSNFQILKDIPMVVEPEPRFEGLLFPKASAKGWVAEVLPYDEFSPLIAFHVNSYTGRGGTYFATK